MDEIIKNKNIYIQYDPETIHNFTDKLFNIDYISKKGLIKSSMDGRNKALEINYEDEYYFLKHYARGGFISKISKDKYIFRNLASTRSLKEYNLLKQMHENGLPVPKPAAFRVINNRFTYETDLLTCKVPNQGTLYQMVVDDNMNEVLWDSLKKTLMFFLERNVYHSDLNSKNIILSESNKFFLLDFDSSFFTNNKKILIKSIYRLERSLNKISNYKSEFKEIIHEFIK
tara:strand:+ start:616 stop:1302 length:687 start_codon:yes stop_codon:yes gene_type:complete